MTTTNKMMAYVVLGNENTYYCREGGSTYAQLFVVANMSLNTTKCEVKVDLMNPTTNELMPRDIAEEVVWASWMKVATFGYTFYFKVGKTFSGAKHMEWYGQFRNAMYQLVPIITIMHDDKPLLRIQGNEFVLKTRRNGKRFPVNNNVILENVNKHRALLKQLALYYLSSYSGELMKAKSDEERNKVLENIIERRTQGHDLNQLQPPIFTQMSDENIFYSNELMKQFMEIIGVKTGDEPPKDNFFLCTKAEKRLKFREMAVAWSLEQRKKENAR